MTIRMVAVLMELLCVLSVAMIAMVLEWLWRLLPDGCECDGCCRQGIRGNEIIVDGKIVCDYCYAKNAWRY